MPFFGPGEEGPEEPAGAWEPRGPQGSGGGRPGDWGSGKAEALGAASSALARKNPSKSPWNGASTGRHLERSDNKLSPWPTCLAAISGELASSRMMALLIDFGGKGEGALDDGALFGRQSFSQQVDGRRDRIAVDRMSDGNHGNQFTGKAGTKPTPLEADVAKTWDGKRTRHEIFPPGFPSVPVTLRCSTN